MQIFNLYATTPFASKKLSISEGEVPKFFQQNVSERHLEEKKKLNILVANLKKAEKEKNRSQVFKTRQNLSQVSSKPIQEKILNTQNPVERTNLIIALSQRASSKDAPLLQSIYYQSSNQTDNT